MLADMCQFLSEDGTECGCPLFLCPRLKNRSSEPNHVVFRRRLMSVTDESMLEQVANEQDSKQISLKTNLSNSSKQQKHRISPFYLSDYNERMQAVRLQDNVTLF